MEKIIKKNKLFERMTKLMTFIKKDICTFVSFFP